MNEVQDKLRFVNVDGLADVLAGVFNRETIERYVQDSLEQLERTSKVPQFIPLLAERFTRERLQSLAHSSGLEAKLLPSLLFMCVHNAGRSQIAAAFMRSLGAAASRRARRALHPGARSTRTWWRPWLKSVLVSMKNFPSR